MYQCYLRFECLHNQFYVILYVVVIILFGSGSWGGGGGGGALIGISPRASKWLETALPIDHNKMCRGWLEGINAVCPASFPPFLLLNGSLIFRVRSRATHVHCHASVQAAEMTVHRPRSDTSPKTLEDVNDLFRRRSGSEPGQDGVKWARLALRGPEMQWRLALSQPPWRFRRGNTCFFSTMGIKKIAQISGEVNFIVCDILSS